MMKELIRKIKKTEIKKERKEMMILMMRKKNSIIIIRIKRKKANHKTLEFRNP